MWKIIHSSLARNSIYVRKCDIACNVLWFIIRVCSIVDEFMVSSCSEIVWTGQCRKKRETKRLCVHTHTNPTKYRIYWICGGIGFPEVSDRAEIHPVMCISVRIRLHT